MYPKNAASPQRIAIGAVVQISDGAVQTSGVSVKVMPQGGAASAGGGTTAYEEGIVHYIPTQAETNYASFMVIAYKTGCIPVAVTIVTSASGVAGYAGLDWSAINAPTTTVDLSGTTIKSTQKVDVETIKTQAVTCAAGVTVLASVGTAATSTAQTGDSYALANGASGFVAIKGDTALTLADTNELQTDWANGGRLDLILDARASQTSVDDLPTNAELATALAAADDAVLALLSTIAGYVDTIEGRIPAALIGGRMDVSMSAIDGDTAALAAFLRAVLTNVTGTVGSGSTTTSIVTSSITPAASVADQFKGLTIKFAQDTTTVALRGQGSDITASTSGGVLTVTALTNAPVSGDTFAIL